MEKVFEQLKWCINEIWKMDEIRKNIEKGTCFLEFIVEKMYLLSKRDKSSRWNVNAFILKRENEESPLVRSTIVLPQYQIDSEKIIYNRCSSYGWERYVSIENNGKIERTDDFIKRVEQEDFFGKRIELITRMHSNLFLASGGNLILQNRNLYIGTIKNILSVEQGQAFFSENLSEIYKCISGRKKQLDIIRRHSGILSEKVDVVLEPNVAALIIHELCHTFEKDHLVSMVGKRVTNEKITIMDKAYVKGSWANRQYDDTGKRILDCYVIKKGILCNVGSNLGKRSLYCENDRARFMVNTSLVSDLNDLKFCDIIEKKKEGIVLFEALGAVNDGKNIVLRRCVYKEICNGKLSEAYYVSKMSFRIADILHSITPLGKKCKRINGVCTNQYEVSYAAPRMELKSIIAITQS